jgi:tetratricopeptide (TPR) repeat protein
MDPNPWLLSALRHLGRLLYRSGEREAASEHLAEAVALGETMSDMVELAPLQLTLVECGWFGQEIGPALTALGRALASGATVELAVDVYAARSRLRHLADEPREAYADVDEALRLSRQLHSPRSLAVAHCAAAQQAHADGDHGSISTWYEAALTSARAANTPYEVALILRAYADSGSADARRAEQMLDEATAVLGRLTSAAATTFVKQP